MSCTTSVVIPRCQITAISNLNTALHPGKLERSEQNPFPGSLPQQSTGGQEHRPQMQFQEAAEMCVSSSVTQENFPPRTHGWAPKTNQHLKKKKLDLKNRVTNLSMGILKCISVWYHALHI